MEVKIQCPCGTRYKFDVEPVDAQLPGPVSCPACGADGTGSGNAIIQQALSVQAVRPGAGGVQPSSAGRPRIRLSLSSQPAAPGMAPGAPIAQSSLQAAVSQPASAMVAVSPVRNPALPDAVLVQADAAGTRGKTSFGLGVLGAVLGTLLSVGIWLAIFYAIDAGSRSIVKLFAIGVGFMAGLGARLLGRDEGSKELGSITAAIAFIGIFAAQYLIAKEQIIGTYKKAVGHVYEERVEYAKKALKAVPTGSDQEIREFLVKESVDEGERIKPSDITGEDIQYFRDKQLPELRGLATGSITKAQYNKDSGVEDLEENSGIKLLLAIKGLGLFTIGAMIIALGTAYKLTATNA